MRRYVLTEKERRKLSIWLETGEEDKFTRNVFSTLRASLPRLIDDILLIIKTRKKLKRKKRWMKRQR